MQRRGWRCAAACATSGDRDGRVRYEIKRSLDWAMPTRGRASLAASRSEGPRTCPAAAIGEQAASMNEGGLPRGDLPPRSTVGRVPVPPAAREREELPNGESRSWPGDRLQQGRDADWYRNHGASQALGDGTESCFASAWFPTRPPRRPGATTSRVMSSTLANRSGPGRGLAVARRGRSPRAFGSLTVDRRGAR